MSLLQSIAGQLLGSQSQDQQKGLLESIGGLLNHPQIGGISGLSQLFNKQGLGHIVSGWISTGPNPPISAAQLQQVLGPQRVAEVAKKLGIDQSEASDKLAAALPLAVDQLTPNGTLPAEGSMNTQAIVSTLLSKFFGS
jgi:uncharacterized protein YidB (DUF937 family)